MSANALLSQNLWYQHQDLNSNV